MSGLKNGKKPLSSKPAAPQILSSDDLFGNPLALPPELQEELDRVGLVGRFVDAKKLYEMNGYHKMGWRVYKQKNADGTMGNAEFRFGTDPEGVIRRGSLLLAVKSKEEHARHKLFLEQKSERYTSGVNRTKAEELRQLAKDSNLDGIKIHEGYEENDD